MRIFIALTLVTLLSACASTPVNVYRDAPESGEHVKTPVIVKVGAKVTPRAINTLAYPMGVRNSTDGYRKVSTLNPVFNGYRVLKKYKRLKNLDSWSRDHIDFLARFTKTNSALDNEDVSIFELKIIGIKDGAETVISKRFTGPVERFNWVELFENKVPRDKLGYLLTGTAYINYIPIFETKSGGYGTTTSLPEIEKEHKQYLVAIPIKFSGEREYRDKSYKGVMRSENGCLFGSSSSSPMAKAYYSNAFLKRHGGRNYERDIKDDRDDLIRKVGSHIFNSGSDFLNALTTSSRTWCEESTDEEEDIFKNKIIKINGKFYAHSYLLNTKFIERNNFLNIKTSRRHAQRKRIKNAAMLLAYKDDSALHEINKVMSDSRHALGELSGKCKGKARNKRELSNISFSSKKSKNSSYRSAKYELREIEMRLNYYLNGIKEATNEFEKLVAQPGGIQASTRSLEEYNSEISMIPKSLNSANVFCGQLSSAISRLGGASYRSTPSTMSIIGGALQNSYRKSINARAGYSSSSSEPGTVESLNSMWSGYRETNKNYMKAIRISRQNKSKNNRKYKKALRQVRNEYKRTGKVPTSVRKIDSDAACKAKGGTYNKRTKNCTIYKQVNTVVLTKLPVNRVGFDSNNQARDDSASGASSRSNGSNQSMSSSSTSTSICTSKFKGLNVMPSRYSEDASGSYTRGSRREGPQRALSKKAVAQCKSKGAFGAIFVRSTRDVQRAVQCDEGQGGETEYSDKRRYSCSVSGQYYCTCGGGK